MHVCTLLWVCVKICVNHTSRSDWMITSSQKTLMLLLLLIYPFIPHSGTNREPWVTTDPSFVTIVLSFLEVHVHGSIWYITFFAIGCLHSAQSLLFFNFGLKCGWLQGGVSSRLQQSDWDVHTHTHTHFFFLFQVLFHHRLLWSIEYSSLCYTFSPELEFPSWRSGNESD